MAGERFAKVTPERKARYLELVKAGATKGMAADGTRLHRQTWRAYRQHDQDFDAECRKAELDVDISVADAMRCAATIPDEKGHYNVTAQIFWLKNRRPEDFRDKHDIALEGSITVNIGGSGLALDESHGAD